MTRMLFRRFGRLVVTERAGSTKHGKRLFRCKCDCGATITTRGSALRAGMTKSCGCYQREQAEYGQIMRWARMKMSRTA